MKISIITILVIIMGYAVLAYTSNSNKSKEIDQTIHRLDSSKNNISHPPKKIANKPTFEEEKKKKQVAAYSYLSYYLLYTVAIPNYCEEKGIDMSSFKKTMEESNSRLITLAKNTLYFDQVSVNEHFSRNRLVLMKGASYTINGTAEYNKTTEKEACRVYSQEYDSLIKQLDFSKNRPSAYKALQKKLKWRNSNN